MGEVTHQQADLLLKLYEIRREPRLREIYGTDLLLLRPDLHVAWRGDRSPAEPARGTTRRQDRPAAE